MFLLCVAWLCICGIVSGATITVPECEPPDFPRWGGYGPRESFYSAGDVIHYYCDTDTHIGGNYYRRCEDTGDWTGDTPVCDPPASFRSVTQTSAADPQDDNDADKAVDGMRGTCFTTRDGEGNTWTGTLAAPGQLIRVMVFPPANNVAYEVFMVKQNGIEHSCGSRVRQIDRLNWEFHNCPEPHNTDIVGVRIKSLSSAPLQLCEVVAHTLTFPTCVDPHVRIENGRLMLTRKTAELQCAPRFSRSRENSLECRRNGVWNRRNLVCTEQMWEGNRGVQSGGVPDDEP